MTAAPPTISVQDHGQAPVRRNRRFPYRRATAAAGVVLAVLTTGAWYRAHNARVPLLSTSVGILGDGRRVIVPTAEPFTFSPGSRVLADSGPEGAARARRQAEWVAAAEDHLGPVGYRPLLTSSLLDLNTLTLENGASVAGWPAPWRYVWPRDAAFAAVALAHTGHRSDAVRVLQFLQQVQPASGVFQARYLPDGSGEVPDDRGEQSDGAGWALWAAHEVLAGETPGGGVDREDAERLSPLIHRSVDALMRATESADHLPPASPDYWEVRTDKLSLGTVAPIAAGLAKGSELLRAVDDPRAEAVARRAADVRDAIAKEFAPNYPRYAGEEGSDAALSFLLPPFTPCTDDSVRRAWIAAADTMKRPAGGVAPGATWKNDGISWTPETALFALTAASVGDGDRARAWLSWLDTHRTAAGSLPEKVLSNGEPAGPAPLAWSSATAVLALKALSDEPAPPC